MNGTPEEDERKVGTLGEMIRNARQARNMSWQDLGGVKFTPTFIAAIEHGTLLPSYLPLEVLATRLDLPLDTLLAAVGEPLPDPSIPALIEDLNFQLSYVKAAQNPAEMKVTLEVIASIEDSIALYRERIPRPVLSHINYLRGRAYLQVADSPGAQHEFEAAIELARGDITASAKARNLLGVAFYMQDDADMALQHHLECLRAIHSDTIKDQTLLHSIYRNLANDYLALHDTPHALAMYKKARGILENINDIERQAAVYWGMAMAYDQRGELSFAKLHSQKALTIYKKIGKHVEAATMAVNMAELLVKADQLPEALELLDYAKPILEENAQEMELGFLYRTYAEFYRKADKHDLAVEYIQRGLQINEQASRQDAETGQVVSGAPGHYAMALWTTALIASDVDDRAETERYFMLAIEKADRPGFGELYSNICSDFAEMLVEWGDLERAVKYFQAALERRHRPRKQDPPPDGD